MNDLSNFTNFMAFALGFATGTYVGLVIEERLSIGKVILRIVTSEESEEQITSFLTQENCGVTYLDAQGSRGNVKMIVTLVNRTQCLADRTLSGPSIPMHSFRWKTCGT
jgi:uncharacterized protein YebE (UPF0316 family)